MRKQKNEEHEISGMEANKLDKRIRDMYHQEAEAIEAPDGMWKEIQSCIDGRRTVLVKEAKTVNEAKPVNETKSKMPTDRKPVRFHKKRLALLAAALVLVFGSITGYANIRKAGTQGYGTVESFSTKFSDFERVAAASGYPGVKAVENFSNGFTYLGVWRSFCQDYDGEGQKIGDGYTKLELRYRGEGKVANVNIFPGKEMDINPKKIVEIYDWDGITVYQTLYVHFFMPPYWEDIITEEQKSLLDEGIAGAGVTSEYTEITRYDIIGFQWQQGGYNYYVTYDHYFRNITAEDLEVITREMIEANREP